MWLKRDFFLTLYIFLRNLDYFMGRYNTGQGGLCVGRTQPFLLLTDIHQRSLFKYDKILDWILYLVLTTLRKHVIKSKTMCNPPISNILMCQFTGTVITKCHKLGGFKEQKCTFSQLWRLEVQDQGASRFDFLWGLSPWLADPSFLFFFTFALWCLSECPCIFFL